MVNQSTHKNQHSNSPNIKKEKAIFKFPKISDSDIAWACRQIGLPDDAFNPIALDTSRCDAIKSEVSVDIAACPGSGKTTLLVAKLAILARDWSSRTRGICVLSHTNVAKREVIERLGNTEVGSKLLHPPHFIGTIHSFANEFLSLPSLASIGKKPLLIDTETTIERRWMSIPGPVRDVLESRHIPKNKLICISANGDIQEFFNKGTPTFKSVQTVCRNSFNNGYLCYEEMLILANDLLNKHPNFNNILQRRFPIVFIDESQDTQSIQQALLNRIFPEHSQCIIQRLGDPNQAIYDSNSDDPDSNNFPIESRKTSLPVSLRFNQKIADLSDPLGLIPYKMFGLGPRKKNACISDITHTIFTFSDQENARNVLPEFGNMILSSFTDEMISTGTFKAIGRIHRGDSVKDGLPKSIPYYWPEYDSNFERTSPKPKSMADHVRFGISESQDSKESHHAIQAISQGIIKLAEMLWSRLVKLVHLHC